MKTVAAVLLTIALALFPLSGQRAFAAVHADGHAAMGTHDGHAQASVHEHGTSGEAADAADHLHAAHLQASQPQASHLQAAHLQASHAHDGAADVAHGKPDCGGDHSSPSCCSLSCHAMVPHLGPMMSIRSQAEARVGPAALPMPRGVGFDGLLRPPRAA